MSVSISVEVCLSPYLLLFMDKRCIFNKFIKLEMVILFVFYVYNQTQVCVCVFVCYTRTHTVG